MPHLWQRLPNAANARVNHQAVVLRDNVYIFGGYQKQFQGLDYPETTQIDVLCFCMSTSRWCRIAYPAVCKIWNCRTKAFSALPDDEDPRQSDINPFNQPYRTCGALHSDPLAVLFVCGFQIVVCDKTGTGDSRAPMEALKERLTNTKETISNLERTLVERDEELQRIVKERNEVLVIVFNVSSLNLKLCLRTNKLTP
nr:unnamed protein product [Spirometra erinaceieuropaei]